MGRGEERPEEVVEVEDAGERGVGGHHQGEGARRGGGLASGDEEAHAGSEPDEGLEEIDDEPDVEDGGEGLVRLRAQAAGAGGWRRPRKTA